MPSSDLDLPYGTLIDYNCLRFQIEFNFRDAKQYWGLDDFMNVKETAVTDAASFIVRSDGDSNWFIVGGLA